MAQDRKVFVGGVPQNLTKDDLYVIFSEYAGVKRAWLQKWRAEEDGGSSGLTQNHRGFGFVIFYEARAIDDLLGASASRFIVLSSGAKLEVKRALSSNKMETTPQVHAVGGASVGHETTPQQANSQSGACSQIQGSRTHTAPRPLQLAPWFPAAGDVEMLRQLALMQHSMTGPTAPGSFTNADNGLNTAKQQRSTVPGAIAEAQESMSGASPAAVPLPRRIPVACGKTPVAGRSHPTTNQPQSGRHALLREAIVRFYHQHRPDKLAECDFLDFICSVYEGREAELDDALRQKYGIGLQLASANARGGRPSVPADVGSTSGERLIGSTATALGSQAAAPVTPSTALLTTSNGVDFGGPLALSTDPWKVPQQQQQQSLEATWLKAKICVGAPGFAPWMEGCNLAIDSAADGAKLGLDRPGTVSDALIEEADSSQTDLESPDFSWVDDIVADNGELEAVSEEVVTAMAGDTSTHAALEQCEVVPGASC